MTQAELATLRQDLPHCELLALIDASTEMMLAVDAAFWRAQENLDALCAQAARLMTRPGVEFADTCWVATPFGVTVFCALEGSGREVLCALVGPDADPQNVLETLRSAVLADHDIGCE